MLSSPVELPLIGFWFGYGCSRVLRAEDIFGIAFRLILKASTEDISGCRFLRYVSLNILPCSSILVGTRNGQDISVEISSGWIVFWPFSSKMLQSICVLKIKITWNYDSRCPRFFGVFPTFGLIHLFNSGVTANRSSGIYIHPTWVSCIFKLSHRLSLL